MKINLVISLIGHDRVGLVEDLSKLVVDCRGNIEASRMAHLGGEFASLIYVTLPAESFEKLNKNVKKLSNEGFKVIISQTKQSDPSKYSGWLPYRIEVNGADHEGIIHNISHQIASFGINIESMETNVIKAPISGTPLFTLTAMILLPPDQAQHEWSEKLHALADHLNVDIEIMPYKG
jgi:glycine cleavage system transcriptional repressor